MAKQTDLAICICNYTLFQNNIIIELIHFYVKKLLISNTYYFNATGYNNFLHFKLY